MVRGEVWRIRGATATWYTPDTPTHVHGCTYLTPIKDQEPSTL